MACPACPPEILPLISRLVPCLFLIVAALEIPANGQSPRPSPKLHRVHPPGGRAGSSVEVSIGGIDLNGADGLWFSTPEIVATPTPGKPGTFRVEIARSLAPGVFDIRAVTPEGVSNPRAFSVGLRPESNETEPNDLPDAATRIEINSTVNGAINPTDVDCFAFEGKAGRRILFDLASERIDGKLDATIRLLDARGFEIAESRDTYGADPLLDVTLPGDGRYVVKVHDVTYAGSPDHFYRLTIHDGPHVDAIQPLVAEPGRGGSFRLIGRNLGGQSLKVRDDAGRPIETAEVTVPAAESRDASGLSLFATGATVAIRGREVRLKGARGTSNPVVLADASGPVVVETEPNDLAHPQMIRPPCTISADFGTRDDIDTYQFEGHKGDTWRIEAIAEGIGSLADPTLVIQRLGSSEPVDLAVADDSPDPGLSPRLNLASLDASIKWQVPADGRYRVLLNDVASTSRGGVRFVYQLNIRRETPDFRLFLVPNPNTLDTLNLRKGGRVSASVLIWRREGFNAPVWVEADELPDGVRSHPIIIPVGKVMASVVLDADAGAPTLIGTVRFVGRARSLPIGNPGSGAFVSWFGLERTQTAVPLTTIWPLQTGNANNKTVVAPFRATRGLAVSVRDGSPFRLTARARSPKVVRGKTVEIDLNIARSPGHSEPITIRGTNLPDGMALNQATVHAGQSTLTVPLTIADGAILGPYTFVFRGTSTYQADPKGPRYAVDEPSNPVALTITKP